MWDWELVFAIGMNIAGSILTSLGMSLQKHAHVHEKSASALVLSSSSTTHSSSSSFSYLRNIRWIGGFLVFTIGQILILVSLGFGSQSLLSVLTSIQLITNAIFAYYFFKEHLSRLDLGYTLLILIGSVGVVLINTPLLRGEEVNEEYDAQTLYEHFCATSFIIYMVIMGALLVACITCQTIQSRLTSSSSTSASALHAIDLTTSPSHRSPSISRIDVSSPLFSSQMTPTYTSIPMSHSHSDLQPSSFPSREYIHPSSLIESIPGSPKGTPSFSPYTRSIIPPPPHRPIPCIPIPIPIPMITSSTNPSHPHPKSRPWYRYIPREHFLNATIAALLGSYVSILGKIMMLLLRATGEGDNQFVYPFTYIILFSLLIAALTNIHFLNHALKSKENLNIVYPIYFACNIVATIVGGLIYYREYEGLTALSAAIFSISIVLVILGVVGLSRKQGVTEATIESDCAITSPSASATTSNRSVCSTHHSDHYTVMSDEEAHSDRDYERNEAEIPIPCP